MFAYMPHKLSPQTLLNAWFVSFYYVKVLFMINFIRFH